MLQQRRCLCEQFQLDLVEPLDFLRLNARPQIDSSPDYSRVGTGRVNKYTVKARPGMRIEIIRRNGSEHN